ncbi:fimbrial protein [Burkholderia catarinensis]|uniref:fimbrial protein n=1 Tax=Burkholderia catarinensis TaxID=1108140 RepID=UPI00091ADC4A|nr:fimbrial protein [Burkholderia catarinensis]KAG8153032.1 fimbrial protein [Burkholderia catarinensis]
MKKALFSTAIGIACVALAPAAAYAYDGTISFNGSITDVTCNINGEAPGVNNLLEVPLGEAISPSTFDTIGKTSTPVPFALNIGGNAGCTDGSKVVVDFDPSSVNVNPVTGNLKLVGTKPADGIEIEIKNAGNGKTGKIPLGKPENLADAQVATVDKNKATLSYTASYVSTKAQIGSGSGLSSIRYVLAYH